MGLEVVLSTSPPPTMVVKAHKDAPKPSTPSEVSFEVEIEEDHEMPQ